ncbi:MAG: CBASS cGAMP-activated phospholipase, partial [Alphaproteobacteria bacterium]|nr:CBASS cGAMP-activated phospholipase [Alphaproteobacteria bacterium]
MTDVDLDLPAVGQTPRRTAVRRRQVLALNGGGFRGLYTANILERAEAEFACRAADRFELLIGTSIGGLIAAGLAVGTPAATIAAKIAEHGPAIFRRVPLWTRAKQFVFRAPYSATALRRAVVDTIGEDQAELPLSRLDKPLAICAVNYTHGRPQTFRSRGLASGGASGQTILQAVLASAAAPTYFPPQTVGQDLMIDGGLIANAPELLGISEACGRLGHPLANVYVMAIGTAGRRQGAALASIGRPGALSWLLRRRLLQMTMASQEALAVAQCQTLL